MSEQYHQWVRDGQVVRGFPAYIGGREHTEFIGKVIAYQEAPTVLVELPDGERVTWAAHLCEATGPSSEPAPPYPPEPPVGTTVTLPTGRTFRRDDHHPDFHWRDGVGWYRWREVRNHAVRDDCVVVIPEATS